MRYVYLAAIFDYRWLWGVTLASVKGKTTDCRLQGITVTAIQYFDFGAIITSQELIRRVITNL
jgi:hypothetical protein